MLSFRPAPRVRVPKERRLDWHYSLAECCGLRLVRLDWWSVLSVPLSTSSPRLPFKPSPFSSITALRFCYVPIPHLRCSVSFVTSILSRPRILCILIGGNPRISLLQHLSFCIHGVSLLFTVFAWSQPSSSHLFLIHERYVLEFIALANFSPILWCFLFQRCIRASLCIQHAL